MMIDQAMRRSALTEFTGGLRERWLQRRQALALLAHAGPGVVAGAIGAQVVAGLLPVGFVLAVASLIAGVPAAVHGGLGSADWSRLRDHLVLAGGLFFAVQLLAPVQEFLGEAVRRRVDDEVRDRLMAAAVAGPGVAVLEDPELLDEGAEAVSMLRVTWWSAGSACAGLIALISRYLQTVAAAVVVSVAYAWWAGPAVLGAALILRFGYRLGLSVFGRVYRGLARPRRRRSYFRRLMLTPAAAKEIRVFGLLGWIGDRFEAAGRAAVEPVWRQRRRIFYGPSVVYTLVAFVLLGVVFAGAARATTDGVIGLGSFMMVMQAGLASIRIGGFIPESDIQTEYGMAAHGAATRFGELTATAAGAATGSDPVPPRMPVREIKFESVSFRYAGTSAPVLDRLDLTIPAGRSLAIVGLNGAGKTTLVKLLARLYEPDSGRITADGVDISTLDPAAWQHQVAAIFQDFVHFDLPLRDNVGFGAADLLADPARGEPAIRRALERAGALEFAEALPRGLDTPLSRQYSDGTELSGGQWQRIATARALMAVEGGATVLVLDEPTANLDARAEVAFFERFLDLTRGATSIVISHRFSTVRRAGHIAVLEDGRVIEDGTHAELIAANGRYAELFTLQAARFAAESVGEAAESVGEVPDA